MIWAQSRALRQALQATTCHHHCYCDKTNHVYRLLRCHAICMQERNLITNDNSYIQPHLAAQLIANCLSEFLCPQACKLVLDQTVCTELQTDCTLLEVRLELTIISLHTEPPTRHSCSPRFQQLDCLSNHTG